MRKGVLIGGAAGLLVLALVFAVGVWTGSSGAPEPVAVGAAGAAVSPAATLPGVKEQGRDLAMAGAPASQAPGQAASAVVAPASGMNSQERRRRLTEVRARFATLTAQGPDASPTEVIAALNELESLSQGELDPRYFQALRVMLEGSAKVQSLNRELKTISNSLDPKDVARRRVILEELPRVSEAMSVAAANVQTYARRATPAGKAQ
ncbi:hypothetical protein [Acidovorax sp. Root219]|uniref:hypothetical protein n=2 Tax=unclassified Acidovorax TaxID=2684926 RepID=UPI00070D24D5|nr:hypothetical protein [Acidovorax sp. Root219]KRC20010.1 hypothetical protein ASE28_29050 [Acidovorax sp. Root219]